jgi:hypothetical protein
VRRRLTNLATRDGSFAKPEKRLDMQNLNRLIQESGFHVFTFFLFLLILVWPILAIPSNQDLPNFFRYLFSAWMLMISLLFLMARTLSNGNSDGDTDEDVDERGGQPRV